MASRTRLFALAVALIAPPLSAQPANSPLKGRVIVVDPGHGVINFHRMVINAGKQTSAGMNEHRLTMDIGAKLGELLQKDGAIVYFTRTSRDYWRQSYSPQEDNRARALFANELKAEALVAVHCDWHPSRKVHGVTTLYEKGDSQKLGQALHRRMVRDLVAHDRRLVRDTFTILDHSEVPAVIVETGFMSHRKEGRKLATEAYQLKVAKALFNGLKDYFSN